MTISQEVRIDPFFLSLCSILTHELQQISTVLDYCQKANTQPILLDSNGHTRTTSVTDHNEGSIEVR
jgi:hypothetical protein